MIEFILHLHFILILCPSTFQLFPKSMEAEAFAVHIARVSSPIPGGAGILSNRDITEIDPCGVVGFDLYSQSVIVDEEDSVVRILFVSC